MQFYLTHPALLVFPRVTYTEGIPDRIHSGYIQYTYTKLHWVYTHANINDKELFVPLASYRC